jgi:hypothetical protein
MAIIFVLVSGFLKKVRADVFVCVIATAAMAVSAVSACACVHHAERVSAPGCHSAMNEHGSHTEHKISHHSAGHAVHQTHSHDNTDTANAAEHDENAFDVPCNCGKADTVTAIAVRSEPVQHPAAIRTEPSGAVRFEFERLETVVAVEIPLGQTSRYISLFRSRSGPSRAPPRL